MILDGRKVVESKIEDLKLRVRKLNHKPTLAIVRVGEDFASGKYVANKINKCVEVGINSKVIHLPEDTTNETVARMINKLNLDDSITGILLQLPLPKTLNEEYLTSLIFRNKDVDGFTERNAGRLMLGQKGIVPCTPSGIIEMLKYYNISLEGKDVLIINRSNIVGKPLAMLMLQENATVTIAHSKTKDLKDKIKRADIIVTAVGKANFLNANDFRKDQTVIDVSINFDENGKMCGDIKKSDYEKLNEMQVNYSPTPGGVGQLTVIQLIENTIKIAEGK